jgi:hypothetical protein
MKVILLLLISSACFSQNIAREVGAIVSSENVRLMHPSEKSTRLTNAVFSIFVNSGEDQLDKYLELSDKTWYSGVDMYIASSEYDVIDAIKNDNEATFKAKKNKKVTFCVTSNDEYFLVMVFSYL